MRLLTRTNLVRYVSRSTAKLGLILMRISPSVRCRSNRPVGSDHRCNEDSFVIVRPAVKRRWFRRQPAVQKDDEPQADRRDFSSDEHASNRELQWVTSDHATADAFAAHSTYNLFLQTVSPFRGTNNAVSRDRNSRISAECQPNPKLAHATRPGRAFRHSAW